MDIQMYLGNFVIYIAEHFTPCTSGLATASFVRSLFITTAMQKAPLPQSNMEWQLSKKMQDQDATNNLQ